MTGDISVNLEESHIRNLLSKQKLYLCFFTLFAVFNKCFILLCLHQSIIPSTSPTRPTANFNTPIFSHPFFLTTSSSCYCTCNFLHVPNFPPRPHRLLPSSRDGGGSWTGTAGGGWHRGHHLFPGSSRAVQYDGCLLRQQAAPAETEEEKR